MKTYFAILALCAAVCACAPADSVAQPFPVKPIRVVVSFAPVGTLDFVARLLAPKLTERLGQPVLVENRAGAGGFIAAEGVARSPADGYTILFTPPATHVVGPFLSKNMTYDPIKDFTPITLAVDNRTSFTR
jgi:tripartite-type tricarboxylate transporter receptor subunit TctC